MQKINIIHEPTNEKPYLIINKPKGLPSAPLSVDDKNNAVAQAIELFPEIKNVTGKKQIEYGLLHRIDTQTDGLLLIAATQEFYDYMQIEQAEGRFIKYYTARCELCKTNENSITNSNPITNGNSITNARVHTQGTISSYFRPYGPGNKEVRPVTKDSGTAALKKIGSKKIYNTEYKILNADCGNSECMVECKISQGYRHQVRCHLAWIGLPIVGDSLYNKKMVPETAQEPMKFTATKIEFEYPRGDLNSYEIALTWT